MSQGFMGYIGLAKESNWGSGQAATDFVEALNENIQTTIDRFPYKNIIGTLAEPDDQAGVRRRGGSITFAAHPVSVGHFLKATLETKSLTVVASGSLWTNTFLTTKSDFAVDCPVTPYTMTVFRDVTTAVRYTGCVATALSFNMSPNQDVRCSVNLVGRGESYTTKVTPTFPGSSSKPFTFDTVSLQLGGSATTKIEALNISIENAFEGIPILNNSTDIGRIRRSGHQVINVSGTLDFSDMTEYNQFINQTEQQFIASVSRPSSFSMVFDIPRMVFTAMPLSIPGRERITVDFTAKGFYHTGSATAIQIDLTTISSLY